MLQDGSAETMTKKERLTLSRERDKLEKVLGGIAGLTRLPAAIFVVDVSHEHIAIDEAVKLGIRTFAMVDTNSDPNRVDFAIPANDDASKSISIIVNYMAEHIRQGLMDRERTKTEKPATAEE
jgi:small subunit ribosomal protein S2